MKVVVVYESMFGNTHVIAEAIAAGLREGNETAVVPVARADGELLAGTDLVVVGGPTHIHGMSRPNTRKEAIHMAGKPGSTLTPDPDADGAGLRDWFASLGTLSVPAAAFDTRLEGWAAVTGRASRGIRRELGRHGFSVIARSQSFLVTASDELRAGEQDRARAWGKQLAGQLAGPSTTAARQT
jgi:hypothetical protein